MESNIYIEMQYHELYSIASGQCLHEYWMMDVLEGFQLLFEILGDKIILIGFLSRKIDRHKRKWLLYGSKEAI
jgi:hypothetical protein